jgi:hypothetical protein
MFPILLVLLSYPTVSVQGEVVTIDEKRNTITILPSLAPNNADFGEQVRGLGKDASTYSCNEKTDIFQGRYIIRLKDISFHSWVRITLSDRIISVEVLERPDKRLRP